MRYSLKKLFHRIRNLFIPTGYIVLYHRVADAKNDPRRLCVSPENFREQINFLKENFHIIPLSQLVEEISSKKLKNKTVAVTFDDGYADNLYNALPILKEYNIPATVFLTAGYINSNRPFYWDKDMPSEDRGKPMTLAEAKAFSEANIIEVGGHTISHPKLAKITEEEQAREIIDGKKIIEEMLGISLASFAYPFGDKKSFSKTTVNLIRRAGYRFACANIHERVTNNSNIYTLPRFIARNWDLEEFKKELRRWI